MPDPASITLSNGAAVGVERLKVIISGALNASGNPGFALYVPDIVAPAIVAALAASAPTTPTVPVERVLALAAELRKGRYPTREPYYDDGHRAAREECAAALEALAKESGNG